MPTSRSGNNRSRLIAVTLGDPAGVGPEVALRALARLPKKNLKNIVLIGDEVFYASLARKLKLVLPFKHIRFYFDRKVPLNIQRGRSDNALTKLAVRSIETAVLLAMRGEVSAIVTPPINKSGLKKAGFSIPGHTEYLARLSNTKRFEMMLVGGRLRVVLVTRHTPIRQVPDQITKKRIEDAISLTIQELKQSFGIKKPRLVVCGLNPHAGEEGTIGREEMDVIGPAVESARKNKGAEITGPL